MVAETIEAPQIEEPVVDIYAETICLDLTFHRPGIKRKGDMSKVQTEADKELLGLSKKIIKSDTHKTLCKVARDSRKWIKARALPSPFKRGTYLIPLKTVEQAFKKIEADDNAYRLLADLYVSEYPEKHAAAKAELKDQYDEANYATDMVRLREAFWVERRLFEFGPPSSDKVGQAIHDAEVRRNTEELKDNAKQIKYALRLAFKKLVSHLANRLETKPDGSRKQFAPTTLGKVLEFLDLFEARNVLKDKDMSELASKAKQVLAGVDTATLKTNGEVADHIHGELSEVSSSLDKLLEDAPVRSIEFDEDDE